MIRSLCGLALLLCCKTSPAENTPPEHGRAEHVVLVVWDGMRPDFLTEANAPTLWKLAQDGVTFRNHHSIYPSLTNVNSTALATGAHPAHSGLLANYEFRPGSDDTKYIRTDKPEVVRRGDEKTGGRYLITSTVAELVETAGGRTAIVGGKTASLLHARRPNDHSVTLFSGDTLPAAALAPIEKALGIFPDKDHAPGIAGDRWTTRALTEFLWAQDVPRYSVLWLSEPDRTQHAITPGSEAALAAIKSSDANLASLLKALEEKGVREKTDVIVASDHGFSTIERTIDLRGLLKEAGFTVITDGDKASAPGEVRVISNGGTVLFYITGHDQEAAARLVEWLQHSDFAGVIFSKTEIPGTFSLAQVQIDTADAPDVVMSFRWTDQPNEHGLPGMIAAMKTADIAAGTHGTLSKFDLHNMLIAAGPDFRRGYVDELPTSNVDVVPTVLHILGLPPPGALDGRILHEAMDREALPTVKIDEMKSTRNFADGLWRQYIRTSKVGDEVYLDEGNGRLDAK